jgi:hypothetical protein
METVLVQLLAPYLPRLLRGAGEVVEGVAGQAVDAAWSHVNAIWEKLRPAVEAKPAAGEAATDVADHPDDADTQAALRVQLRKLLTDDPALASEIQSLLEDAQRGGVVASGSDNVAIGGSVTADRGGIAVGRDITGGVNKSGS